MKKKVVQVLLVLILVVTAIMPALGQTREQDRNAFPGEAIFGPFPLDRPMWTQADFNIAQSQVFPEGCFGHGFETWMVFYNSTDTAARVVVIASSQNFYFFTAPFDIQPHQRITCDMRKVFVKTVLQQFVYSLDVSFQVVSTSKGVYAQESMYWNNREGGHTSTGIIEESK